MASYFTFPAFNQADGTPLTGLTFAPAPSPTSAWLIYVSAATQVAATGPTITEVGGGLYSCQPDPTYAGIVDLGPAAAPRYVVLLPLSLTVVPVFNAAGTPTSGLSGGFTWDTYRDVTTGGSIAPPPTCTDLGGGLYRIDGLSSTSAGILDFGVGQNPQRMAIGLCPVTGSGPIIQNVTPTPGSRLLPGSALGLDVVDNGSPLALGNVILTFTFTGSVTTEVVWNGAAFMPLYVGSAAPVALSNGWRFSSITRSTGWPQGSGVNVTLDVLAFDSSGVES